MFATAEGKALLFSASAAAALVLRARRLHSQASKTITILGFGSLLSERSARVTFPTLSNWRLGRVHGHRRVFAHSPSVFVQRGIADQSSLQMASLSAEPCQGSSFVVTVFEVPDGGLGMEAFREREEARSSAAIGPLRGPHDRPDRTTRLHDRPPHNLRHPPA
jgi:hypothetical protein